MLTEALKVKLTEVILGEYAMLHHDLDAMSCYQKAGYNGFKRMFEYFAYDRMSHIVRLRKFLGDQIHCYPMVPVSTIAYIGTSVVETLVVTMAACKKHIELLGETLRLAIDAREDRVMQYLGDMVKDQSDNDELLKCFRMAEKIENTKRDLAFIQELDCGLHEKFKCRLEKMEYKDWK